MLVSGAVPAALVSLLRWGTSESPQWLVAKGRLQEAQQIVHQHVGDNYQLGDTPPIRMQYRRIFDDQ